MPSQSAISANVDTLCGSRRAAVARRNVQVGHGALQGLGNFGYRTVFQRLLVDRGNRSCQVHFLLCAISYHNHFVQHRHVFLQGDVQSLPVPSDALGDIAHEAHFEDIAAFHAGQAEVSVHPCDDTVCGAAYSDARADNGNAGLIHHDALHVFTPALSLFLGRNRTDDDMPIPVHTFATGTFEQGIHHVLQFSRFRKGGQLPAVVDVGFHIVHRQVGLFLNLGKSLLQRDALFPHV